MLAPASCDALHDACSLAFSGVAISVRVTALVIAAMNVCEKEISNMHADVILLMSSKRHRMLLSQCPRGTWFCHATFSELMWLVFQCSRMLLLKTTFMIAILSLETSVTSSGLHHVHCLDQFLVPSCHHKVSDCFDLFPMTGRDTIPHPPDFLPFSHVHHASRSIARACLSFYVVHMLHESRSVVRTGIANAISSKETSNQPSWYGMDVFEIKHLASYESRDCSSQNDLCWRIIGKILLRIHVRQTQFMQIPHVLLPTCAIWTLLAPCTC